MDSKIAQDEREHIRERLKLALAGAGVSAQPTTFARAYNARADGASITVHAARKWLGGESIPTHEKVVILAVWLGVNAAWLRFGTSGENIFGVGVVPEASVSTPALVLINDIMSLPPKPRRIVRNIVDAFLLEYEAHAAAAGDKETAG